MSSFELTLLVRSKGFGLDCEESDCRWAGRGGRGGGTPGGAPVEHSSKTWSAKETHSNNTTMHSRDSLFNTNQDL